MHVHQMRDELCVGGKARMFAEMTAERHGVRAGERSDQSMKKQNGLKHFQKKTELLVSYRNTQLT